MEKLLRLNVGRNRDKNEKFKAFVWSGIFGVKTLGDARVVLAGGACRSLVNGEDPNDFDVFIVGDSPELKKKLIAWCDENFENKFRCPEEMLYTYEAPFGKVQIICPKVYKTIEELLDSFDFTACRAVFTGNEFYTYKSFIKSVKKKILQLHKVSYPLATMGRMYKYKSYGYNIYEASENFIREVHGGEFPDDSLFQHYID